MIELILIALLLIYFTPLWLIVLNIYVSALNTFDNIIEKINSVFKKKESFIRCVHEKEEGIIQQYIEAVKEQESNESSRITISNNHDNPICLGDTPIHVNVPMVFHLLDSTLIGNEHKWTNHINDKIINQLNIDYNRNQEKYMAEYLKNVNKLFEKAHPSKLSHYLNVINSFPKNINVEWKFYLKKIIMKPINDITFNSKDNEHIFSKISLEDPEFNLNIVIAPATNILGVSVFPYSDRNPTNNTTIDPEYKYRNAIIINTKIFLGNTEPFTQFRTFTHEIGHWCGLLHPFDNKASSSYDIVKYGLNRLTFDKTPVRPGEIKKEYIGDLVADTSIQNTPTYGTVYDSFKTVRQVVGGQIATTMVRNTPYAHIFEKNNQTPNFYNFMDYTDDKQMCMFTHIQMVRMIYMMSRFRPNFITS